MVFTPSGITAPNVSRFGEIWSTSSTFSGADAGQFWARSEQQRDLESRAKFFQRLATPGRHNPAVITDRRKFTTKITLYGKLSFNFGLESTQSHFPGLYTPYKKPSPIFSATSDDG